MNDQPSNAKAKTKTPGFRRGSNFIAVASGKKVLLFDGDLGLANVDVQLGLMPKRDLNDVIRGRLSLDKVVQRYEEGGFDIVAGRSGQASLSSLPSQRLAHLRDQILEVADNYDVVIADLGAGVDRTVRMLSATATRTILLSTDEPTSLTDAYAFIKLGNAAGMSKNISIVVNQASSDLEGEKTYKTLLKACQNFLRLKPPLLGMVRVDPKVKESIRHQTPILIRSPNTQAAEDVEMIAEKVMLSLKEAQKAMAEA
jgi:flagellar biosynthesis protein FlhG